MKTQTMTIDPAIVERFLEGPRIAVVGASDDPKNFGRTILRALRDHGVAAVAVHPRCAEVDGQPCYPDVASVPGRPDGALVMVHRDKAAGVVDECARIGVKRVWLFQGIGGAGSVSAEAVDAARRHGIEVVAGACPLMFLEPVGWFHRLHRGVRRAKGTFVPAAADEASP